MANSAGMRPTRKALVREIRPHADQAAALLKALANEQRLLILCHLQDGPLSVGELNDRVDLSQSALSQHLGVLRESNIVSTTRDAQTIRYEVSSDLVRKIIGLLYKEFCAS
jgi:ArsR family transcriptional regulator, virulence genes transcriptional regulator